MLRKTLCLFVTAGLFCGLTAVQAQDVAGYKYIAETIYERTPVKVKKRVAETVYETKTQIEQRPVWRPINVDQKRTYYKEVPVTRTRTETYTVRRPVVNTRMRDETYQEEVMETVTVMRDEDYIVERPYVETEYRDEQVVVPRTVTRRVYEHKPVTTYRPQTITTTERVNANLVYSSGTRTDRPRLKWLTSGYYTDPRTGQQVFRRSGFHWVASNNCEPTSLPVVFEKPVTQTVLVPETIETRRPIDLTETIDHIETRKVPVKVQKTRKYVETRKVPVEIKRPRTVTRTRRVPYQEESFVTEQRTREVPYTETVLKKFDETIPSAGEFCEWENVARKVDIPRRVNVYKEVTLYKHTPKTVWRKVPVDSFGRPLESLPSTPRIIDVLPNDADIADTAPELPSRSESTEVKDLTSVDETTRLKPLHGTLRPVIDGNNEKRSVMFPPKEDQPIKVQTDLRESPSETEQEPEADDEESPEAAAADDYVAPPQEPETEVEQDTPARELESKPKATPILDPLNRAIRPPNDPLSDDFDT